MIKILMPLPPLAEQHRIVAKVDELMALCDRLEAQLAISETESRRLLDAVLHEALLEKDGENDAVGRDAVCSVAERFRDHHRQR